MQNPKRVFLGSIATETNTFSPLRTDILDFEESFMLRPVSILKPRPCAVLSIRRPVPALQN